jgi:abortive infection bacteriophage resistance protein
MRTLVGFFLGSGGARQMNYLKPALTFEQQADRLIRRGLEADKDRLINCLKSVNYYRFSGYLVPFKQPDDNYAPGTRLTDVWNLYRFDRRFRLLVLDGIERFEIGVRTRLVYELVHRYGPFCYTNRDYLPQLNDHEFNDFLRIVNEQTIRSREIFVSHFKTKYSEPYLPLWMAAEVMSFGAFFTLYNGADHNVQSQVGKGFGVSDIVLKSWIGSINVVRNFCAHHSRLWNRQLGYKPKIPAKDIQWQSPVVISNERIFGILTILKYTMATVAPQSNWKSRLRNFLAENLNVPIRSMGFPSNWEDCPIWKN